MVFINLTYSVGVRYAAYEYGNTKGMDTYWICASAFDKKDKK